MYFFNLQDFKEVDEHRTQYTVCELNELLKEGMTLDKIFQEERESSQEERSW